MPIDKIKNDFKEGKYRVEREPEFVIYHSDFDFVDENQTVLWNRGQIKLHNEQVDLKIKEYDNQDADLKIKLKTDCVKIVCDDLKLKTFDAELIYDMIVNLLGGRIDYYFFDKFYQLIELISKIIDIAKVK